MKSELKLITPEWAKNVLNDSNVDNRRLRPSWVKVLANSIERGEWQITHQGIAFDVHGKLIDGQHRLSAVAKSGQSVQMIVTTGLDPQVFAAVDMHARRSIADLTKMPRKTAEVCKLAAYLFFGDNPTPGQVSSVAKTGLAEVHDDLLLYSGRMCAVFSSSPIRTMASLMVFADESQRDDVFSSYKRLCNLEYCNMTPYESAFSRRVSIGVEKATGSDATYRLMTIAYKVLNIKNKNNSKLYITEDDKKEAINFVKTTIGKVM